MVVGVCVVSRLVAWRRGAGSVVRHVGVLCVSVGRKPATPGCAWQPRASFAGVVPTNSATHLDAAGFDVCQAPNTYRVLNSTCSNSSSPGA